jgi:hypothetical protein
MSRTSKPILAALIAAAGLLALSNLAAAQPKAGKAPAKKAVKAATFTGDLAKTTGKKGKITAAQIKTADAKTLQVVLDKQGLKMAKALAGKRVEVTGVPFTKGKALKTWLRIKTFKEAPAAAPAEPADEEGDEGEGEDVE